MRTWPSAKVPTITIWFWLIKLATTACGEAISDYFATHNVLVGGIVEVSLFLTALWWQLRATTYVAWRYWYLALSIAIGGTGLADFMHLHMGLAYQDTSMLWAVALVAVFLLWFRVEGTLSIHSITTSRREYFYWAAIFATFALGTAVGDFTASTLSMGYLASGVFFFVAFVVPGLAYRWANLNGIVAFWLSYILTRPLGASFADYFSKAKSLSGLNGGDGPVSLVLLVLLVALLLLSQRGARSAHEQTKELV